MMGNGVGARAGWLATGIVGGFAVGLVVWSSHMRSSRNLLFSRSPVRRLAALGHLAGQPSVETARLLADYIRWEPHPALRRRATAVLRRVELYLE